MRWVSYNCNDGQETIGVVNDGVIHRLDGANQLSDLLAGGASELLEAGEEALRNPSERIAWGEAKIGPPLNPPSIRDAMCFHEHIRNCRGTVDPRHNLYPIFYFSNPASIIGPYDEVRISPGSERFDYELEVAAVIGQGGMNIRPEQAMDHVAGYTIYCDWSARDIQMDNLGPIKGKDGAITLGPVLVTPDEIEPLRAGKGFDLDMSVDINGELFTRGNWSSINWSFADVISYVARGTTLRPGDVIGSGTVGRGCLYEHWKSAPDNFRGWLKPGDQVTLEIERIGRLKQTVVAGLPKHPLSSGF